MEKKERSSLEKASILFGLVLIGVAIAIVLWVMPLVSAGEVIPVELDVDDENDFVSVEYGSAKVSTRGMAVIGGPESSVEVQMFSDQIVEIEFKVDDDVVDQGVAIVIDKKGKIDIRDFDNGECDIEFGDTGDDKEEYFIVFVSPGANEKYGINQKKQEFVLECKYRGAGKTAKQVVDAFLLNSVRPASDDYFAVARVRTVIVQVKITNIKLDRDSRGELEITGESNMYDVDFEWQFADSESGMTRIGEDDTSRRGKIDIDIDGTEGLIIGNECSLLIQIGGDSYRFHGLSLDEDEEDEAAMGAFVEKKKIVPMSKSRESRLTPTPTPTPTVTRIFAKKPLRAPTPTPEAPISGFAAIAAIAIATIVIIKIRDQQPR